MQRPPASIYIGSLADTQKLRYKIGDCFVSLPLAEAQEMLSTSTAEIEGEVSKLEDGLSSIRDQMKDLKVQLYARFGRGINLET